MTQVRIIGQTICNGSPVFEGDTVEVDRSTALILRQCNKGVILEAPAKENPQPEAPIQKAPVLAAEESAPPKRTPQKRTPKKRRKLSTKRKE